MGRLRSACSRGAFLVAFFGAAIQTGWSQSTTANVVGVVSDATGSVMPGVKVTELQLDTARERTTTTDSDGAYSVRALPIGRHILTAEAPGFKREEVRDIVLQIDQTLRVDL